MKIFNRTSPFRRGLGFRSLGESAALAAPFNRAHIAMTWAALLAAIALFACRTAAADTTPPTSPSGLTGVAFSFQQVNLSWTGSTDDVGVTGYEIEGCNGSGCSNYTLLFTVAVTRYGIISLAGSSTYNFRVRARDAAGNLSGYSNIATATTPAAPTPPTAPSALTATPVVSTAQVNLSWGASTPGASAINFYQIERCAGAGCTNFLWIGKVFNGGTTLSDTNGTATSTTYRYRVIAQAFDSSWSPYSNIVTVTTWGLPAAPLLSLVAASSAEIDLAWNADSPFAASYVVERCGGVSCTWSVAGNPSTPRFNDTGRSPSTSYSYRVSVRDSAGNTGPPSNVITYLTPASSPDCN